MKKIFSLFIVSFVIVTASFGADFELGLGGGINYQGTFDMQWKWLNPDSLRATLNNNELGAFLFFDATYAEFSLGFSYCMYTCSFEGAPEEDYSKNEFAFEMALLGKYPFYFDRFSLFPLLGISYQTPFKGGGLGIMTGIGTNFNLTERLYLRGEILYGIRLIEVGTREFIASDHEAKPGHVPRIIFGIGYSFNGKKNKECIIKYRGENNDKQEILVGNAGNGTGIRNDGYRL